MTAAIKNAYDTQRKEIKGNFTEQKALARFEYQIQRDELRLLEKEELLTRTNEVT